MYKARFSSVCLMTSHADVLRACFVSPSCTTNICWNKHLNSFSIFCKYQLEMGCKLPENQPIRGEGTREESPNTSVWEDICLIAKWLHLNPLVPRVIKIHFLLMISTHNPEKMLSELIKWSAFGKCSDLQTSSLNSFCKEMYRDQFGEFVCGYWGLKG